MEIKSYKHNPPHMNWKGQKYFITAASYKKRHFFSSDAAKEYLLGSIKKGFENRGWKLEEWVILNNHYHILLQAPNYEFDLGSIIQEIHKFTAIWIKKNAPSAFSADKVWWNYWDSCITFESSYYTRINYIWNNPVKHGYVQNPVEYKFGSFIQRMKDFDDYENILTKYPSDKCNVKDDF